MQTVSRLFIDVSVLLSVLRFLCHSYRKNNLNVDIAR